MSERQHSVLGPSAAHRWLNCTASVKLCATIPDKTSADAQKGTEVHELCAYKVMRMLGNNQIEPPKYAYTKDDELNAQAYADFIKARLSPDSSVMVEQKVDYSEYTAEGAFGTADCVIVDDDQIQVVDYKNGVGVKVNAEYNVQMMLYALGAYSAFRLICDDIKTVSMSIFQPNVNNISTFTLTVDELEQFAVKKFKPAAEQAMGDDAQFRAGEWCRFCNAKPICSAYAAKFRPIKLTWDSVVGEKRDVSTLTEDEILEILRHGDELCAWIKDVKEYALDRAKEGREWPGFKVAAARSVRKFSDNDAVTAALTAAGIEPYETSKKLKTITTLEKELGKAKTEELIGHLLIKQPGKDTLVAIN